MLKYFSTLNLPIHCIRVHNILPQSSAGIGNILKIARANDIIQANHKYHIRSLLSNSFSQNFTAHTGQDSLFTDSLIFVQSKDIKFFHNLHNTDKLNFVCACISFNHKTIDCFIGNLISFTCMLLDELIITHNKQLSIQHFQTLFIISSHL